MTFNTVNQYTPSHKVWDHVGNIIPDIEHSEGIRPAHEFKPASWLPVQFKDKHYENWMTVLPGKVLALDPDGRVMPAEYGLTSATVTYTQNDVDNGVVDIATGVAVTTTKVVTLSNLSGVRDATWTAANAGVGGVTSGFLGRYGQAYEDSTQKYPIGVAPYAYLQWAGGDGFNPTQLRQHNYNMQHQVAVLCDYVIKLPMVPAQVASETVGKTATASALVFGTDAVHTRAFAVANTTGRYNASTGTLPVLSSYPVIAIALDNTNLAKQTARTALALSSDNSNDDVSTILVAEKTALSAVTQAGDYFLDHLVGVVFIYSSDGATLPTALSAASGTVSLTYYRNGTAPGVMAKFGQVLAGGLVPGDFLKAGTESNLVKATSEDFKEIIGQVLALDNNHPKDALDRVRTAYSPAIGTDSSGSMANGVAGSASLNLGQLDQMPGSATGGYNALLHYAGAADTLVIINLISR